MGVKSDRNLHNSNYLILIWEVCTVCVLFGAGSQIHVYLMYMKDVYCVQIENCV